MGPPTYNPVTVCTLLGCAAFFLPFYLCVCILPFVARKGRGSHVNKCIYKVSLRVLIYKSLPPRRGEERSEAPAVAWRRPPPSSCTALGAAMSPRRGKEEVNAWSRRPAWGPPSCRTAAPRGGCHLVACGGPSGCGAMAAAASRYLKGCGSRHTGPFSAVAELLGKHRERSLVPCRRCLWARFVSLTPRTPAVGA